MIDSFRDIFLIDGVEIPIKIIAEYGSDWVLLYGGSLELNALVFDKETKIEPMYRFVHLSGKVEIKHKK